MQSFVEIPLLYVERRVIVKTRELLLNGSEDKYFLSYTRIDDTQCDDHFYKEEYI